MKSKFIIIKCLILMTALFIAVPVLASEFSFDTQNKDVSLNQQFKVDLNINTNKESINAVSGRIVFPKEYLELSEIRVGESIVNFWVDKPTYTDEGIVFSGITPGGYNLDKGLILSIILKTKKEGNILIKIENGSALKNDGSGTKSKLKILDLLVNISGVSQQEDDKIPSVADIVSPDTFKPEIAQDPNLFYNKWFLSFIAQDKDSGIAKYEVRESRFSVFNFSKWLPAESPYVLNDQELKSNIFVKAIDKAGNERIIKLSPQNKIAWYTNFDVWFIIGLVLTVALIYSFLFNKIKH